MLQGKRINRDQTLRRIELAKIEDHTLSLSKAKTKLRETKCKWEDFKTKTNDCREEKLLDQCDGVIEDEEGISKVESRKRAIKNVKEKLNRNASFYCLTSSLGKEKLAVNNF